TVPLSPFGALRSTPIKPRLASASLGLLSRLCRILGTVDGTFFSMVGWSVISRLGIVHFLRVWLATCRRKLFPPRARVLAQRKSVQSMIMVKREYVPQGRIIFVPTSHSQDPNEYFLFEKTGVGWRWGWISASNACSYTFVCREKNLKTDVVTVYVLPLVPIQDLVVPGSKKLPRTRTHNAVTRGGRQPA